MVLPIKMQHGEGDAPFNMAQLYYYRLNELMSSKSRAKISGDLIGWHQAVVEIHTQISFKLSKDDNSDITKELSKIGKYLNSPMPRNRHSAAQMQSLISGRVAVWLNDLDHKIMRQMEKHKMIFPRIDVRTPMQTLKEDMGLQ